MHGGSETKMRQKLNCLQKTNSKPSYFETILHPRASKHLKMRAELHKSRKTHVKHEEISRMGPKWSRGGL